MEDKQKQNYLRQQEIGDRLRSVTGTPEWPFLAQLVEEEIHFHRNKANDKSFRNDPNQYANIVRALDNADAIQAVLDKIDTAIRLGLEARKKLDEQREREENPTNGQ